MNLPRQRTTLFLLSLVIASVLGFPGIHLHSFWEDEALTALFARNYLAFGRLTAWDGTNLVGYGSGMELDENLENRYQPPLQYYLAAAGMAVFGDHPGGARALFVVAGILGVAVVGWWARRFSGGDFPWWLPPMLLALSPAYLLFVRNCRYYAPGVLLVVLVWAAWAALPRENERETGKSDAAGWLLCAIGVLATLGLCATNYVYAITAVGLLPFLLPQPWRWSRTHVIFAAAVGTAFGTSMLWVYLNANPREILQAASGVDPYGAIATKIRVVGWWLIRDAGYFEFFAWPMLIPLILPWTSSRFAPLRGLACQGWTLAVCLFVSVLIVAAFGPQTATGHEEFDVKADIRFLLPLIPLGVMVSATSLFVLYRANRILAGVVAAVLILTNVPYLGATRKQPRHHPDGSIVRCSLFDYAREILEPYDSVYDTLVRELKTLPPGTTVRFFPSYLAYPAMYAAPELRYCGQLPRHVEIRPELLARMPAYLTDPEFKSSVAVIYGFDERKPAGERGWITVPDAGASMLEYMGSYLPEPFHEVPILYHAGVRPEIAERWFSSPVPGGGYRGALQFYRRRGEG